MNARTSLLLSALLLLAGCSQTQQPTPVAVEPLYPPVGEVELRVSEQTPSDYLLLDVGIGVFENIIDPGDYAVYGEWVFEEIRENEVHYLPYVLRQALLDSNQWGAVRVLPQQDPSVDLFIEGSVLTSNGSRLELEVTATDSTGRVWLNKVYADEADPGDYPEQQRYTPGNPFDPQGFKEPFADLYEQVANDLLEARAWLAEDSLREVRRVSTLRYAADLSPEAFGHMLDESEPGRLEVVSMPAEQDPMLQRVEDMRQRHLVFIDTVDDYYGALYDEMQPSYVLWRRYSHDQQEETADMLERYGRYEEINSGGMRSFLTLTQRYDRYRWSKIFEQEFRSLAEGFNRELAPAILELNEQVHGVSGTMEEQYIQWRRILRRIFALESGMPVDDPQLPATN